jgi:hypothetical protein
MVEPDNLLQSSISVKGKASYYHAHAQRHPESGDRVLLQGDAAVFGDGVPKLLVSDRPRAVDPVNIDITKYSWADDGTEVSIYIPLEHPVPREAVSVEFETQSLRVHIKYSDSLSHSLNLTKLMYPIRPDESSWRVRTKNLVVKLDKFDGATKWHVLVARQ